MKVAYALKWRDFQDKLLGLEEKEQSIVYYTLPSVRNEAIHLSSFLFIHKICRSIHKKRFTLEVR